VHFCSYRTYEEWKRSVARKTIRNKWIVLTVPMRNGNQEHKQVLTKCGLSSYRTYEEWKHGKNIYDIYGVP